MAAIVQKVISAFETMISELKALISSTIASIEAYGSKAETEFIQASKDAISRVQTEIDSIKTIFTDKLKALFSAANADIGPAAKKFVNDIRTVNEAFKREIEKVISEFKREFADITKDVRGIIARIKDDAKFVEKDATGFITDTSRDTVAILDKSANDVVAGLTAAKSSFTKIITVDGSFVYSHGLQFAEAAVISSFSPLAFVSLGAAAAMIFAAINL